MTKNKDYLKYMIVQIKLYGMNFTVTIFYYTLECMTH